MLYIEYIYSVYIGCVFCAVYCMAAVYTMCECFLCVFSDKGKFRCGCLLPLP